MRMVTYLIVWMVLLGCGISKDLDDINKSLDKTLDSLRVTNCTMELTNTLLRLKGEGKIIFYDVSKEETREILEACNQLEDKEEKK